MKLERSGRNYLISKRKSFRFIVILKFLFQILRFILIFQFLKWFYFWIFYFFFFFPAFWGELNHPSDLFGAEDKTLLPILPGGAGGG